MTNEEIRAIALEVARMDELMGPKDTYAFTKDRMVDFATRFLAAIAEKAEPVAWVSEKSFAKMRGDYPPMSMYFRNTRYNEMNIPLYTHPAIEPAQPKGHYKDQLIDELDNRAAPLPDEVAQMVEALRRHEWIPVIQQAAEMIERLARERDELLSAGKQALDALESWGDAKSPVANDLRAAIAKVKP